MSHRVKQNLRKEERFTLRNSVNNSVKLCVKKINRIKFKTKDTEHFTKINTEFKKRRNNYTAKLCE